MNKRAKNENYREGLFEEYNQLKQRYVIYVYF